MLVCLVFFLETLSFNDNRPELVVVFVCPSLLGRCPLWLSFVWEVYQLAVLYDG